MKTALFLGAWAWCGILAAAGYTWAAHAFYLGLFALLACLAAVLFAGDER